MDYDDLPQPYKNPTIKPRKHGWMRVYVEFDYLLKENPNIRHPQWQLCKHACRGKAKERHNCQGKCNLCRQHPCNKSLKHLRGNFTKGFGKDFSNDLNEINYSFY